jgi:hypothetical protein
VCSIPAENSLTFGNDMAATGIVATFRVRCCVAMLLDSGMFISAVCVHPYLAFRRFVLRSFANFRRRVRDETTLGFKELKGKLKHPHHDVCANKGKTLKIL